jgi:hypothetical protein
LAKIKFEIADSKSGATATRKTGDTMWDQYKKTFIGMQVVILLVTAGMFTVFTRNVALVAKFFATMQVASLLGAYWGDRLRKRVRAGAALVKGGL